MKIQNKGFTLIELMIVIAIIAIIAAIAIPNLIEARKSGNESSAIGSLKAITTSETMFAQADKDTDGRNNYASNLSALGAVTCGSLIDSALSGGSKTGYAFFSTRGAAAGDLDCALWCASGVPTSPGTTGDRYFWCNQAGQIFYSNGAPPGTLDPTLGTGNGNANYVILGK